MKEKFNPHALQFQKASPQDLKILEDAITDYNITIVTELPRGEMHKLDFVVKNPQGEVMGGIQAYWVNWGILHIDLLYVFEAFRGLGIGSALLAHIEQIAEENNCHIAHLDTFDFQAKNFYQKHGFTIFGRLKNAPKGHSRIYFRKDLGKRELTVTIRWMSEEDIELLVKDYSFPWAKEEVTREQWRKNYEEQTKNIRTVAILEKGHQIVGYGSLLRRSEYPHFANIPEINAIWIHETFRSSGLGTKLIAYLEEMARKEGYKQIGIGVGLYKDYGPAQNLYFKLGFKPDGNGITYKCQPVIPGESHPVNDDLLLWMTKPL